MRYKIILNNTKETITIREEELPKVLNGIRNKKMIIVSEGIINPSFLVAIVADKERMEEINEAKRIGMKFEEPSPFAKLLAGKMEMFNPKQLSEVQEEVAREERRLKSGKN